MSAGQNGSPEENGKIVPAVHQQIEDDTLTVEVIATRKSLAEQTPDLSSEVKAQIAKHYQGATDLLAQKVEAQKKTTEWKLDKETGPAQIAEYRAKLADPLPAAEPVYPEHASVAELDALLVADEDAAKWLSGILRRGNSRRN